MVARKREEDESFEDYKTDLRMDAQAIKDHLKGNLIWDSKNGPYKKPKDENG